MRGRRVANLAASLPARLGNSVAIAQEFLIGSFRSGDFSSGVRELGQARLSACPLACENRSPITLRFLFEHTVERMQ